MAGERKCPECGYENEPGARFCGNCGNPLRELGTPPRPPLPSSLPEEIKARPSDTPSIEPEPQDQPIPSSQECPKCHYPAESEDVFCRQCGGRLAQRPTPCPRCGDPIDPGEKFCNRCGLALR